MNRFYNNRTSADFWLKYREFLKEFYLRLLTHVGFLRQNGLILSEVFLYMERSKNQEKSAS